MNLQNISLIFVLSASCSLTLGFSVEHPRLDAGTNAQELLGPKISGLLNSLLHGLIIPNPFSLPVPPINFTAATANSSVKVKGFLNMSTVELHDLKNLNVTETSLILNGIVAPIPLIVSLDSQRLPIYASANYTMDALLAGLIPLRGQGLLTVGVDVVSFGCTGQFTALGKMTLKNFDYALDISTLKVTLSGLSGGDDLGVTVGKIIADMIQVGFEDIKPTVIETVTSTFNGLELTLSDLLELLG